MNIQEILCVRSVCLSYLLLYVGLCLDICSYKHKRSIFSSFQTVYLQIATSKVLFHACIDTKKKTKVEHDVSSHH